MNLYKKIIIAIIIAITSVAVNEILINTSYAENINTSYAENIEDSINGFQAEIPENRDTYTIRTIVGRILGYLQILSGIVLVVVIATLGIKFITATPDVRVELKSQMFKLVVGTIIVFGAITISRLFVRVAGG